MNEEAKKEQSEAVEQNETIEDDLSEDYLSQATEVFQRLYKNNNERLRVVRHDILEIKLSQKKLVLLVEEARKLTSDIHRMSKNLTKLEILVKEQAHLKKAVGNALIALDRRADEVKDVKLKHDTKVLMRKFKTANVVV